MSTSPSFLPFRISILVTCIIIGVCTEHMHGTSLRDTLTGALMGASHIDITISSPMFTQTVGITAKKLVDQAEYIRTSRRLFFLDFDPAKRWHQAALAAGILVGSYVTYRAVRYALNYCIDARIDARIKDLEKYRATIHASATKPS